MPVSAPSLALVFWMFISASNIDQESELHRPADEYRPAALLVRDGAALYRRLTILPDLFEKIVPLFRFSAWGPAIKIGRLISNTKAKIGQPHSNGCA